jgi:hypothetical protein
MCLALPEGLLETATVYADEFSSALQPILQQLCNKSNMTSILGDYISIMNCWSYLLSTKALTVAVANDPAFFPTDDVSATNGRVFQVQSALASLFSISYLPDEGALLEPQPSVRTQCFADVDIHRPSAELSRTIESLRQASKALVSGICSIISPKGLLAKERPGAPFSRPC